MPPILRTVIFLSPPKGPTLVLKDKETWIGRGSFELSEKAQSICSRRQACLKHTNTVVQLECHGLNPIYFVVCHSVSFQASENTPFSGLHLLKKGEAVELTHGDKFFLAPKECLLTVGIKHVQSESDSSVLQLTRDAKRMNIEDDRSFTSQAVLPKATQTEQASATCLAEQPRLLQTDASARLLNVEGQGPSVDGCSAGYMCNFDPVMLKCTCPAAEGCKCSALIPTLAGCQVPLTNGGSICQVDASKSAASGKPALPVVLINRTRSNRASNASETNVIPDSTYAPAGGFINISEGVTLAAGTSLEGRFCGSSTDPSGEILVQGFRPDDSNDLESKVPLEVVEKDHNDVDEGNKRIMSKNVTSYTLSALVPGPSQTQDDRPSATICTAEPDQGPLQSWQPCASSKASQFSRDLPFPCADSDVEVMAFCGNPVLQEIPEKQDNMQAVSVSELPASFERHYVDPISSGLPVTSEEYVLDSRRISKQHELVHLSKPENEGNIQAQIQSQSVQGVQSILPDHGTNSLQCMESVIATVSGYDSLVRARLINLINSTGAVYTGSLTKSNTHVVCWKFKGAKYEMAKKLGKSIVNHRWFEDCLKARKRLPEAPYRASGEVVEPLIWDHSSVQHPPSNPEFVREQHSDSLFKEDHSQLLLQPAIEVGECSVPLAGSGSMADHSSQRASICKSRSGELDRGKKHSVDMNIPANRWRTYNLLSSTHDTRDVCQIRSPERSSDAHTIHPYIPQCTAEQESDEFWNEVIRTCDQKGKQVASHSREVCPRTELRQHTRRHFHSPIAGSSSRVVCAEFDDEIINGRRDPHANVEHSSGDVQRQRHNEMIHSYSPVREEFGSGHSEEDHMNSCPEILVRKRKHVSANFSDQRNEKHPKVRRKPEIPGVSNELPNAVGSTGAIFRGISTGGESTPVIHPVEHTASTVDRKVGDEHSSGLIDTLMGSNLKPGQKVGESLSSNEIICVICHIETMPATEGVLSCGHTFCYPCIQRWADEAKLKSPTCPLCKVPFDFITFREMGKAGAGGSSPALEERVVEVGQGTRHGERSINLPSLRIETLCVTCGSRDTSELLLLCTNCRERACHTFCLDPPRPPGSSWFCSRCSQMQSRMSTRELYGRLLQGNSRLPGRRRPNVVEFGMALVTESNMRALVARQSSPYPPRRGRRQHSLYSYLVRNNDDV